MKVDQTTDQTAPLRRTKRSFGEENSALRGGGRFAFKTDSLAARLAAARARVERDGPPTARFYWWDSTRPGFGLRVSPKLTGAYVFRYRFAGRPQRVMVLGRFEKFADAVLAWGAASGKLEAARRDLDNGKDALDPLDERRANRGGARSITTSITVADAVERFLADRKRDAERRREGKAAGGKGLRDSTAAQYAQQFKRDLLPQFGSRPLRGIRASDVRRICDLAHERGAVASAARLRDAIGSLFTWAQKHQIVERNPARQKGIPTYYEPKPRDRVLNDGEIRALFAFVGQSPSLPWLILLLTLATAQRSGELLRLRWSDVHGDVLVVPGTVAKSGIAHRVPLSPLAMEIVGELRARAGSSEWVAPGKDRRRPLEQQTLGVTIRRALERKALTIDFAPHDLRRTARTHFSALGVSELIGERILAHDLRSKVAASYAHHSFEKEMRDALDRWGAKLCELRGRPASSSNVVALPARAAGATA